VEACKLIFVTSSDPKRRLGLWVKPVEMLSPMEEPSARQHFVLLRQKIASTQRSAQNSPVKSLSQNDNPVRILHDETLALEDGGWKPSNPCNSRLPR
jgi:hypothetical protein